MKMLADGRRLIVGAAYVYLALPVCLFFIGWIKPYLSVPMTALFSYGCSIAVRRFDTADIQTPAIAKKQFFIIALLLSAWVFLSGVGGLAWQNRDDHLFRNAVYMDLVNNAWPVVNTDEPVPRMLVYYFGFWLPGAAFAKLFGIAAGYGFQFFWALLGTGLAFCLISYRLGKFSWITALMFIFFSGLDIIPSALRFLYDGTPLRDIARYYLLLEHIELSFTKFNSSCNTTLLFWLYNRAVPFWVGFMLVLLQKNNRHLLFTYALLALFCPFAMVGALPFVAHRALQNEGITLQTFRAKIGPMLLRLISLPNIVGFAQALIVASFYATNIVVGSVQMIEPSVTHILMYLLFFVVEYGVFLYWLYPSWKRSPLMYVLILLTAVFNFVMLGNHYDFGWRTGIPFIFYLMLLVTEKLLHHRRDQKLPKKAFLIAVLLVGAITPGIEIARTVRNTAVIAISERFPDWIREGSVLEPLKGQPFRCDSLQSSFSRVPENRNIDNVTGSAADDEFFNRYLRK